MVKKNIFLTGRPRIGKTTIIKKILATLKANGGGFYTEEIREKGQRSGFRIRGLTGETGILAHLDIKGPYRVGRYGVDVQSFERVGVKVLREALAQNDLIVMDEIGRMELYSYQFQREVTRALDSSKIILGVIQDRKDPFLDKIRAREDVEIIRVSETNRDEIVPWVKGLLLKALDKKNN